MTLLLVGAVAPQPARIGHRNQPAGVTGKAQDNRVPAAFRQLGQSGDAGKAVVFVDDNITRTDIGRRK